MILNDLKSKILLKSNLNSTPKNYAINLQIESSKLLEMINIETKCLDIFSAILLFANSMQIDLVTAIRNKLLLTGKKYPKPLNTPDFINLEQNKNDFNTSIQELIQVVDNFVASRDWVRYNLPEYSICNISVEASELLEIFTWKNSEEINKFNKEELEHIRQEIADVAFALLNFCSYMKIEILF